MPSRRDHYIEDANRHLDGKLCPACGQRRPCVEKLGFSILPDGVAFHGRKIGLTFFQLMIFELLLRSYPEVTTRDRIYNIVYADASDLPQPNTFNAHIWAIRKKLKPTGIIIKAAWGRGWRLILPDEATEAPLGDQGDVLRGPAAPSTDHRLRGW